LIVAEPVAAAGLVETDLELQPRTIEGMEPIDVLLDQQRSAAGYRTSIDTGELLQDACMK